MSLFKKNSRRKLVTVSGPPGALKTTLCVSWAIQASRSNKKACFVALDLPPGQVITKFREVKEEDERLQNIDMIAPEEDSNTFEEFKATIYEEEKPDVLVIDNLSLFVSYFNRSFNDIIDYLQSFVDDGVKVFACFTHGRKVHRALEGKTKIPKDVETSEWEYSLREAGDAHYFITEAPLDQDSLTMVEVKQGNGKMKQEPVKVPILEGPKLQL